MYIIMTNHFIFVQELWMVSNETTVKDSMTSVYVLHIGYTRLGGLVGFAVGLIIYLFRAFI